MLLDREAEQWALGLLIQRARDGTSEAMVLRSEPGIACVLILRAGQPALAGLSCRDVGGLEPELDGSMLRISAGRAAEAPGGDHDPGA